MRDGDSSPIGGGDKERGLSSCIGVEHGFIDIADLGGGEGGLGDGQQADILDEGEDGFEILLEVEELIVESDDDGTEGGDREGGKGDIHVLLVGVVDVEGIVFLARCGSTSNEDLGESR